MELLGNPEKPEGTVPSPARCSPACCNVGMRTARPTANYTGASGIKFWVHRDPG